MDGEAGVFLKDFHVPSSGLVFGEFALYYVCVFFCVVGFFYSFVRFLDSLLIRFFLF